jgi:predicted alpha/beta-fold hydrolase
MRIVDRVCLPALVITAEDDPFVPLALFQDPKVIGNPHITVLACRHGGHCGFVGPPSGEDDGYWAEKQIVAFVEQQARGKPIASEVAVNAVATAF